MEEHSILMREPLPEDGAEEPLRKRAARRRVQTWAGCPGLGGTNPCGLLFMGRTRSPPTIAWRIAEDVNVVVRRMETTEDLAYTSRTVLVVGMLFLSGNRPYVNLGTPGAYINRGV